MSGDGLHDARRVASAEEVDAAGLRIASALLGAADLARPIIEACAGYRELARAAGFGDSEAQQIGVDYHAGLLRVILR